MSIQKQEEDEDDNLKGKKKVTIITIEEEEALEKQINEIRDRIRRGEITQQQFQEEHKRQSNVQQMDSTNKLQYKSLDIVNIKYFPNQ